MRFNWWNRHQIIIMALKIHSHPTTNTTSCHQQHSPSGHEYSHSGCWLLWGKHAKLRDNMQYTELLPGDNIQSTELLWGTTFSIPNCCQGQHSVYWTVVRDNIQYTELLWEGHVVYWTVVRDNIKYAELLPGTTCSLLNCCEGQHSVYWTVARDNMQYTELLWGTTCSILNYCEGQHSVYWTVARDNMQYTELLWGTTCSIPNCVRDNMRYI